MFEKCLEEMMDLKYTGIHADGSDLAKGIEVHAYDQMIAIVQKYATVEKLQGQHGSLKCDLAVIANNGRKNRKGIAV